MKRIVLVHRYYWPDTPLYASLLKRLAETLVEHGYRVTVLTAQPSYTGAAGHAPKREEPIPGLEIRRFALLPESRRVGATRVLNLGIFTARVLLAGLCMRRADVVMAATAPPVAIARVASIIARRHQAAFVYHNQDIYPEVAIAAGLMRHARLASFLRWLDRRNQLRADQVVVLSEDMRRTVEARGVEPHRIRTINNFNPFTEPSASDGAARAKGPTRLQRSSTAPLEVVFAGNLGRFQGLETIIEARERAGGSVRVHFIGDGALRSELQDIVAARDPDQVEFHGFMPAGEVEIFLRDRADLGLVPLAPGVIRSAYPSKTFSYLGQGCPIVALVEGDSELAKTVTQEGIGFQCEPGDVEGLASVLRRCANEPDLLPPMRDRAARFAAKELSGTERLGDWLGLFNSLAAGQDEKTPTRDR